MKRSRRGDDFEVRTYRPGDRGLLRHRHGSGEEDEEEGDPQWHYPVRLPLVDRRLVDLTDDERH